MVVFAGQVTTFHKITSEELRNPFGRKKCPGFAVEAVCEQNLAAGIEYNAGPVIENAIGIECNADRRPIIDDIGHSAGDEKLSLGAARFSGFGFRNYSIVVVSIQKKSRPYSKI